MHEGLVVSSGLWVDHPFKNDLYFELLNEAVIETIRRFSDGIPKIEQKGISDLAINGKKIAGTSLFRSKNYLLYQASILVDTKIELISKYLKHPTKRTDYRKGKSHKDFLTDLRAFDSKIDLQNLLKFFEDEYRKILEKKMAPHLMEPMTDHLKHLYKRAERG